MYNHARQVITYQVGRDVWQTTPLKLMDGLEIVLPCLVGSARANDLLSPKIGEHSNKKEGKCNATEHDRKAASDLLSRCSNGSV